ncbi:MAG TPA: condensation domain-containing protein, partial [Ktedonobacteraceae bacterium]|nr:condensation domain-containing protein [Ktedonobacteraceae bacterium]
MQTTGIRGSRLSIQQAHLWELQRDTQTYWVQCAVSLDGPIQSEILRLACEDVIYRHEILRTLFRHVPGMDAPVQMVNAEAGLAFKEYDLRHLNPSAQQYYVEELLLNLRESQPDLAQDPIVHVSLLKRAEQQTLLLLGLPALCADIPTLERFIAELAECYVTRVQSKANALDEDVLQYADVSAWQNEILKEEDAHLRQNFWAQMDLSRLASVRLPFGQLISLPTAQEEFTPQSLAMQGSSSLATALLRSAEQVGISLEAFLLSCWQLLLWRLTGQEEISLGVACDGRHYEDLENALGLYTRFVPLFTSPQEEELFSEFLPQVQNTLE